MTRSESPSTALRAPSPPLGEKDGMRGCGSWKGNSSRRLLNYLKRSCHCFRFSIVRDKGPEKSRARPEIRNAANGSPSPWGEGWGEGERSGRKSHSQVHNQTLAAELNALRACIAANDFNREHPHAARPLLHPFVRLQC